MSGIAVVIVVLVAASLCVRAQVPVFPGPPPTPMTPEPAPPFHESPGPFLDQAPPTSPPVEGRGIWIEMKTLPTDPEGVRALVRRLARCHFNMLLVEVTYEGQSLVPSAFTSQDARFVGQDPLAVLIDEAHRNRMEVHAWMWALKQARYRPQDAAPGGPILARHPEWMALNQQGKGIAPGGCYYWLCPSRPEVRAFLVGWMEDLVTRYRLDGLHLDYIRYDKILAKGCLPPYCCCAHCRDEYRRFSGVDCVGLQPFTAPFRDWEAWREGQVNELMAEISTRLKQVRPALAISAAVYPDAVASRRYFGQDWGLWVRNRLLDFVCPMSYQDQTDSFVRRLGRYVQDGTARQTVVLPGVGVNEIGKKRIFSHDVLIEQVQAARRAGMLGNVLFSYSVMTPAFEQFLIDKVYPNRALVPYRDPQGAGSTLMTSAQQVLASLPRAYDASRQANWLVARAGDLQSILAFRAGAAPRYAADAPPMEPPSLFRAVPSAVVRSFEPGQVPRLDGSLSDDAWKSVPAFTLSCDEKGGVPHLKTLVRLATDGRNLYVAWQCDEPEVKARVDALRKARARRRDEDHVALFLDPGPSRSQYLVLRVNLLSGQTLEKVPSPAARPPGVECPENVPDTLAWTSVTRHAMSSWSAEMCIPLEALGAVSPDFATTRRLGLNLLRARHERGRTRYSEWSCTYGQPYNPVRFGTMEVGR